MVADGHDLGRVHDAGQGLQAERTDMAWQRTSLALLVNGALLLIRQDVAHPNPAHAAGGVLAIALAAVAMVFSLRRRRFLARRPLPEKAADPVPLLVVGSGTLLLGAVTLGVLLLA